MSWEQHPPLKYWLLDRYLVVPDFSNKPQVNTTEDSKALALAGVNVCEHTI
jgi:hypothetical protein